MRICRVEIPAPGQNGYYGLFFYLSDYALQLNTAEASLDDTRTASFMARIKGYLEHHALSSLPLD